MTRDDVAKVLADNPWLTAEGNGMGWHASRLPLKEQCELRQRQRDVLLSERNVEASNCSLEWLKGVSRSKNITKKFNSYCLKHEVERWFDNRVYVIQGAFIVAALYRGFRCDYKKGNLEVHFNIKSDSVRRASMRPCSLQATEVSCPSSLGGGKG